MEKYSAKSQEVLGVELLKNCRNELYLWFPFLGGVFSGIDYLPSERTETIGTDGNHFLFHPVFLLKTYEKSPALVRRAFLHMLFHCLYLHFLREETYQERLWNLSCDITAEIWITRVERKEFSFPEGRTEDEEIRRQCFLRLGEGAVSAELVYDKLQRGEFPFCMARMEEAFRCDDHGIWEVCRNPERDGQCRSKWGRLRSLTGAGGGDGGFGHSPTGKSNAADDAPIAKRRPGDYRRFLKQFAVPREELELDTDSFDYIYYSYGMEQYGNLPLIEPLEYKEGHKLEELVVAIDTSGSCSAEVVGQFLEESYGILGEKENFFRKMKVYFIQCDCFIQDVAVIHSKEEWMQYRKNIQIRGRSDTDFRPVFRYVEELQREKELRNLKALIYFTDGDGIYPQKPEGYQTAFVILKASPHAAKVPKWAHCLIADRL